MNTEGTRKAILNTRSPEFSAAAVHMHLDGGLFAVYQQRNRAHDLVLRARGAAQAAPLIKQHNANRRRNPWKWAPVLQDCASLATYSRTRHVSSFQLQFEYRCALTIDGMLWEVPCGTPAGRPSLTPSQALSRGLVLTRPKWLSWRCLDGRNPPYPPR